MDAPSAVRIQNLRFPLSALDVMMMLIGPAMGMEKINPAKNPINTTVIKLSIIYNYEYF